MKRPNISEATKTETESSPTLDTTRALTLVELDDLAAHVDGSFVVVVKVSSGRYRRRCYLTARSAQAAAERAIDRGETAVIYLAQLQPLYRISGGAQ